MQFTKAFRFTLYFVFALTGAQGNPLKEVDDSVGLVNGIGIMMQMY